MKITTSQLRQIIREEIQRIALSEGAVTKLNTNKLQQILTKALTIMNDYGRPILNKGSVKAYIDIMTTVQKMLDGGPEKFNGVAAMKLYPKVAHLSDSWSNVSDAGKEWVKFQQVLAVLENKLDDADYDDLANYWNKTLSPAVANFKA